MRVSGPWASPLETNPSPSTFFPSRETPHCFQPGRTPGVVEGGQGCGMERVEGGPAQQRTAPPPALLVCLWILSLQAREEEPSVGRGPSLPGKRYLQRVWVGRALCGVERISVDGALGGWRRQGLWDVQIGSNSTGGNGAGKECLLVSNTPIVKAIT